ncbi:MAG: septum formation protein Maf [Bdellovibrionales bacterium GWA2_49_15]|nr:MAG: septum formation protein Maf [Bdellovibrionales bacterium GWA2_49_15]HAZ14420.1 septum formation protein Maf [Bdellovibrionales bacterium]
MLSVNPKFQLVLASQSPRRKELLSHLGIPFAVIVSDIDEDREAPDPIQYVQDLAVEKGEAVLELLRKSKKVENPLVISADTTVVLGKKIYGKPASRQEAGEMLLELSNRSHLVYTAVSIKSFETTRVFYEKSEVEFGPISPDLLEMYLATGESLDKAGAYGIQGAGLVFIKAVRGSYSNVVGFPLDRFITELKKFLQVGHSNEKTWRRDLFA